MPKIKESTITKNFIKWLNTHDRTFAMKRYAGPGRKGQVDITGCCHGIRLEIEVKVGDNTPTKLQLMWLDRWARTGAITYWANTLEDLKTIFLKKMRARNIK